MAIIIFYNNTLNFFLFGKYNFVIIYGWGRGKVGPATPAANARHRWTKTNRHSHEHSNSDLVMHMNDATNVGWARGLPVPFLLPNLPTAQLRRGRKEPDKAHHLCGSRCHAHMLDTVLAEPLPPTSHHAVTSALVLASGGNSIHSHYWAPAAQPACQLRPPCHRVADCEIATRVDPRGIMTCQRHNNRKTTICYGQSQLQQQQVSTASKAHRAGNAWSARYRAFVPELAKSGRCRDLWLLLRLLWSWAELPQERWTTLRNLAFAFWCSYHIDGVYIIECETNSLFITIIKTDLAMYIDY